MTSSLVGSEMCIRDRHMEVEETLLTARGSQSGALKRQASTTNTGARAVSYTHLTLPTICSV
eukprot:7474850-Prorocentrum_lima.AAC.1